MNYKQIPIEKTWVSHLCPVDSEHILVGDLEVEGEDKFQYCDNAKRGDITYSHDFPVESEAFVVTSNNYKGMTHIARGCWYLVPKGEIRSTFFRLYNRHTQPSMDSGVEVGENVNIQKNCSIGEQAFSYYWDLNGWNLIHHAKKVIIGDNVDIGSNVCIDRGLLENTVIGNGVKIDNLCHIAHDVHIGKHTLIIANTMIGGRTKIGENCKIGPSTSLLNGLKIGDNVTTGMHSCVLRNVNEGKLVYGVPAKEK